MRRIFLFLIIFISFDALAAKNVILFIGDGMGQALITATRYRYYGPSGKLTIDTFPYTGLVKTHCANEWVTDSASAASAMATGVKTNMGVLGQDASGVARLTDGKTVENISELAKKSGKAVGIVTTVHITDGTPAAFYAHIKKREDNEAIAKQLLTSGFDLFLGGGAQYFNLDEVKKDRTFDLIQTKGELSKAVSERVDKVNKMPVLGLFAAKEMAPESEREAKKTQEPSITDMALGAVDILATNPKGYFLMVEGGAIDKTLHKNDLKNALSETFAFDQAISAVMQSVSLKDTLILVTADHETGGIAMNGNFNTVEKFWEMTTFATGPEAKNQPKTVFRQTEQSEHTAVDVSLFATGAGAEKIHGTIENTEIFSILAKALAVRPSS